MKKVTFLAIILPAMVFGQDVLWSDDKSTNAFNCDGFVTDAICCQDDLCNGQDENSCNSDPKTSLFCKWDRFFSKCLAFRDVENNVCCQSKPVAGCSDLMKGVCPAHFQVPENCCSNDGKKWKDLFRGVRPGHVCCNAPCNEMKSNQCPLPDHCKKIEGRSLGEDGEEQASSQSVGINARYLDHSYSTGKHYGNIYATADQLKHSNYASYKTPEITVDDVIDMLIKAMSNDGDVVKTDETLNVSPLGRHKTYKKPHTDYYIDPNLYIKHALNPFRNYNPAYYKQLYYPSHGYGKHSYGGQHGGYGHHQPSYGHSQGGYGYDKHSYGGQHGGYKQESYNYKPKYDDGYGYKEESYDYKPEPYGYTPKPDPYGYTPKPEPYGYKPKYEEYKSEPYGYKPKYEEYKPEPYGYSHYKKPYGYKPKYEKPKYDDGYGYKPKYDEYKPKYEEYKPDYKPKYDEHKPEHEHEHEPKTDDWEDPKPDDGWERKNTKP